MRQNEDGKTVASFDVLAPQVIINWFRLDKLLEDLKDNKDLMYCKKELSILD
jgi:hypothetical protein